MSQPFQTLFSYNKSMEPASSLNIPGVDNPATVEATPSVSGPSHRDDHPPADPLAGLQAGNASGAQPGGAWVIFVNTLVVQETDIPPTLEWCCCCMQLISRDPSKAGTDFVCIHHKHTPCMYCTKKTHQGCMEILLQWVDLVDKVIQSYYKWATVLVEDMLKVQETLNEHYQLFHHTVQVPNIPKDQHPPPCAHCSCCTHGSSWAAFCDCSCLPDGSVPATCHCSPMPSASHHICSSSGSSLNNYPKGICIIEVLVSELQEEQIMDVSWASQTSLWGFTHKFYWCIFSSLSLVQIILLTLL